VNREITKKASVARSPTMLIDPSVTSSATLASSVNSALNGALDISRFAS
jgi:hypothetical protein